MSEYSNADGDQNATPSLSRGKSRIVWVVAGLAAAILAVVVLVVVFSAMPEPSRGDFEVQEPDVVRVEDVTETPSLVWSHDFQPVVSQSNTFPEVMAMGQNSVVVFTQADKALTMLDLNTGDVTWSTDLTQTLANQSVVSHVFAVQEDSASVIAVAVDEMQEPTITTIVSVSSSTGDVESVRRVRGRTGVFAYGGALWVSTTSDADKRIERVDPANLETVLWEAPAEGTTVLAGHIVTFSGLDGTEPDVRVLDIDTGEENEWLQSLTEKTTDGMYIQDTGGLVITLDKVSDGFMAQAYSPHGDPQWGSPAIFRILGVNNGLLFAQDVDLAEDHIMRVDPQTGLTMWDEPMLLGWIEPKYVDRDYIVAHDFRVDRVVLYDAHTGVEISEAPLEDVDASWNSSYYIGDSTFYRYSNDLFEPTSELVAHSLSDGEVLWTYDLPNDEGHMFQQVGASFLLIDGERGTISRLR